MTTTRALYDWLQAPNRASAADVFPVDDELRNLALLIEHQAGFGALALGRTWRMPSGQPVDLRNPSGTKLTALDVYTVLRRQCRYAGRINVSVLAHLALCVRLGEVWHRAARSALPRDLALAYVAAHDLHEAYFPDLIPQIKHASPRMVEVEHPWEAHVHRELKLEWPKPPEVERFVKVVDARATTVEAHAWGFPFAQDFDDGAGGPPSASELAAAKWVNGISDPALWKTVTTALAGHLGAHHALSGPFGGSP